MASKKSKKSAVHEYCDITSLHGFIHVSQATCVWARLFWLIPMAVCFGWMTCQVYFLVENYREEKTASNVLKTYPNHFPPLVLCPMHFINITKAIQLHDFTPEMYYYLLSLLSGYPFYNSVEFQLLNDTQLERVAVDKAGSLDVLFDQLSYTTAEIVNPNVPESLALPMAFMNTQRMMTTVGMCYKTVRIDSFTQLMSLRIYSYLLMRQPTTRFPSGVEILSRRFTSTIGMGPQMDTVYPTGEMALRHGMHYYIKVTYKKHTRQNLGRKPCMVAPATFSNFIECQFDTVNRFCQSKMNQSFYIPGTNNVPIANAVDFYQGLRNQSCFSIYMYEIMTLDELCHLPCVQESYDLSVTPYDEMDVADGGAMVFISFADPINSILVEENKIDSLSSVVSNIGGTLGLWSGASMLSIYELVYFCTVRRAATYVKPQRKTTVPTTWTSSYGWTGD